MNLDNLIEASAWRVDEDCMDYGGHEDLGVYMVLVGGQMVVQQEMAHTYSNVSWTAPTAEDIMSDLKKMAETVAEMSRRSFHPVSGGRLDRLAELYGMTRMPALGESDNAFRMRLAYKAFHPHDRGPDGMPRTAQRDYDYANGNAAAHGSVVRYDSSDIKVRIGHVVLKNGTVVTGPCTFTEKPAEPLPTMCCGGTAVRAECPYHGPGW